MHILSRFAASAAAVLFAGATLQCNALGLDQDTEAAPNHTLLTALAFVASPIAIEFDLSSGSTSVRCNQTFTVSAAVDGSTTKTLNLTDARFYVSNVRLISGGTLLPVTLPDDGVWQYGGAALLDFENATGNCSGSSDTNTSIRGYAPVANYTGIVFDLGLPDSLNSLSNSTTPSPLNINQMYWSWSLGYKFTRLEFQATDATFTTLLHLGSLDCGGDVSSNTCSQPFRANILASTTSFNTDSQKVTLDMNRALSGFDPSTGSRRGCMPLKPPAASGSTTEESVECPKLLSNFGIDSTTGQAASLQSAFVIQ